MPEEITGIFIRFVGAVLHPGQLPFISEATQLLPAGKQQRAHNPALARQHTAKPGQTRASEKVHDHCLDIVIELMGRDDEPFPSPALYDPPEPAVTKLTGGNLDG